MTSGGTDDVGRGPMTSEGTDDVGRGPMTSGEGPARAGMTSETPSHPTLLLKGRAKTKIDSGFRRNDGKRAPSR